MALHHPQRIRLQVFARHKPGLVLAGTALALGLDGFELGALGLDAAYAQALALAQRVKTQTHVFAQHAAFVVLDRARRLGDVAVKELSERPLADETDAGRVFLFGIGQADLVGDAAHLGLVQFADWEQRLGELGLIEPVQKVTLVFGRVQALEQLVQAGGFVQAHAGVVAGGDFLRAQAHGVV